MTICTNPDSPEATTATPLDAAKADLIAQLARADISSVVVTYDGEGDSGFIDEVRATLSDATVVGLGSAPTVSLNTSVEDYCWALLEFHHAGYGNNDGGFGEIVIDVAKGSVTIIHSTRITDIEESVIEA